MDTLTDQSPVPSDQPSQPLFSRVRLWYHGLPDKKKYFEFITAFLSVPVLVTVLISNINSLQGNKKQQASSPTPVVIQQTVTPANAVPTSAPIAANGPLSTPSATPGPSCTPGIGPVAIDYPQENDVVPSTHVCLDLSRQGNYCAVQYADRVNSGTWSNPTSGSVCLDNLPNGLITVEVKVHSTTTGEETVLTRHFTVSTVTPTLTPSPTPASTSATIQ